VREQVWGWVWVGNEGTDIDSGEGMGMGWGWAWAVNRHGMVVGGVRGGPGVGLGGVIHGVP
jgi:hypothetical protein